MAGAALGGFASGFAKGLGNFLLMNRQEQRRREDRDFEMRSRADQMMLPIAMQLGGEYGDWTLANEVIGRINPEAAKRFKREGSPFDILGPMLTQQSPSVAAKTTEVNEAGLPMEVEGAPTLPATFGTIATQPVSPRTHFLGQRMTTPDERTAKQLGTQRGLSEAEIQGKVDAARRLLQTGGAKSMAEALDRVGLRQTTSGSTSVTYGGVVKGDQEPDGTLDVYGRLLDKNQYYRKQRRPDGTYELSPTVPPGGAGGGDFLTRAAIKMGYRNAAEVPVEKRQELFKFASEIETEESRASSLGSGIGDFQAPLTLPEAQAVPGAVVGSSSADYAGQTPATREQAQRRENATNIKTQLDHIKTLLTALPSEKELGGLAPGASNVARRRLPQYRNAYAQLESAINNIRASLNRTMQANVGTETERDAERALSTIADFEGRLLDPFRGDTQESAARRINETIAYLDEVMKGVPGPVVPNAAAKPATAPGTPTGRPDSARPAGQPYKDENGNWVIP